MLVLLPKNVPLGAGAMIQQVGQASPGIVRKTVYSILDIYGVIIIHYIQSPPESAQFAFRAPPGSD
jgi:hypothetical protein